MDAEETPAMQLFLVREPRERWEMQRVKFLKAVA